MAKKTRWGRIAKLTELSAKVSSSYLGQRVASGGNANPSEQASASDLSARAWTTPSSFWPASTATASAPMPCSRA